MAIIKIPSKNIYGDIENSKISNNEITNITFETIDETIKPTSKTETQTLSETEMFFVEKDDNGTVIKDYRPIFANNSLGTDADARQVPYWNKSNDETDAIFYRNAIADNKSFHKFFNGKTTATMSGFYLCSEIGMYIWYSKAIVKAPISKSEYPLKFKITHTSLSTEKQCKLELSANLNITQNDILAYADGISPPNYPFLINNSYIKYDKYTDGSINTNEKNGTLVEALIEIYADQLTAGYNNRDLYIELDNGGLNLSNQTKKYGLEYNFETPQDEKEFSIEVPIIVGWSVYGIGLKAPMPNYDDEKLTITESNGFLKEIFPETTVLEIATTSNLYSFEIKTSELNESSSPTNIILEKNSYLQHENIEEIKSSYNEIVKRYEKGKEVAKFKCSISDYFDKYGNLAISKSQVDKPFLFELYNQVLPFYPTSTNENTPFGENDDGSLKVYEVVDAKLIYDGSIMQELTVHEVGETNITNGTEGLEYEYDKSTKTFSAKGIGTATDKDIVIASQVNGKFVDKILNNSFMDSDIESVVIPETMKTIEVDKNDVYSGAFYNCQNLSKVYFNAKEMEDLGTTPFASAGINASNGLQLIVGKKATKIPSNLFNSNRGDAPNIRELYFEENSICHTIGERAFYVCPKITTIDIPNSVVQIGEHCFDSDTYLSQTKQIKIGKGLKTLGNYAFADNSAVEKIYFNAEEMENLPISKNNIFNNCGIDTTNGITLYIGKDVKKTPSNLYYCTNSPNISKIVFDENSICSTISQYSFDSLDALKLVIIRGYVTTIKSSAFGWDINLESVVFPKWLKIIENSAFGSCDNISKIFFEGSSDDWDIDIGDTNQGSLLTATIYYYSETSPTTFGNYWHYDENDEPIIW